MDRLWFDFCIDLWTDKGLIIERFVDQFWTVSGQICAPIMYRFWTDLCTDYALID